MLGILRSVSTNHDFLNKGGASTVAKNGAQIEEKYQKLEIMCPTLVSIKCSAVHENVEPDKLFYDATKSARVGYNTLDHPRYFLGISPIDYLFFKHVDNYLWQKCLKNQENENFESFMLIKLWMFDAYGWNLTTYFEQPDTVSLIEM